MTWIDNVNYSNWKNDIAKDIASKCDTDGIYGLNGNEVQIFKTTALDSGLSESTITELLGGCFSTKNKLTSNPNFAKAIDYYNSLDSYNRSNVTYETYNLGQRYLYELEKNIDQAFIDCKAYQDILIVPQKRPRPEKLLNFDIEYLRKLTNDDMNELHELKQKIEYIIEEANEKNEHVTIERTPFDIESLAKEHLGMSYQEFSEKYKDELEFCKTVTYADLTTMNETQRYVYSKAKAYAKELLLTTINEAHTVRWDYGDRLLEETSKYNEDCLKLSDFEYGGLKMEDFNNLSSGIMKKSFKEALLKEYSDYEASGIKNESKEEQFKKPQKIIDKNSIKIKLPDGSEYNIDGSRIK